MHLPSNVYPLDFPTTVIHIPCKKMKDKIRRDVANIASQEHCCMSSNIFIKHEVCLEVGGWQFELEASYAVIIPFQFYCLGP
jgi:hypothetical protein